MMNNNAMIAAVVYRMNSIELWGTKVRAMIKGDINRPVFILNIQTWTINSVAI